MVDDTRRVAVKPTKRRLAQIDRCLESIYTRIGHGVEVPMLELGTVFDAGRAALLTGKDAQVAEQAMAARLAEVRVN